MLNYCNGPNWRRKNNSSHHDYALIDSSAFATAKLIELSFLHINDMHAPDLVACGFLCFQSLENDTRLIEIWSTEEVIAATDLQLPSLHKTYFSNRLNKLQKPWL